MPAQSQRPSNCFSSSSCPVFVVIAQLLFALPSGFTFKILNCFINLNKPIKQLIQHKKLLDHFSKGIKWYSLQ